MEINWFVESALSDFIIAPERSSCNEDNQAVCCANSCPTKTYPRAVFAVEGTLAVDWQQMTWDSGGRHFRLCARGCHSHFHLSTNNSNPSTRYRSAVLFFSRLILLKVTDVGQLISRKTILFFLLSPFVVPLCGGKVLEAAVRDDKWKLEGKIWKAFNEIVVIIFFFMLLLVLRWLHNTNDFQLFQYHSISDFSFDKSSPKKTLK